ncbi:hypothetical protein [Thalassobacillus pellis]|uniref:hypothetical protein n=1 Tax=Thalassobacillus pellis TaxID=748008 RepID=UPI0019603059|nr:hypothetical protein [Thalassobacillus pellis]MBM7552054.1 hypothetical protein [Thalassobacillus pellis]
MKGVEMERFNIFLEESFSDGVYFRELRLSPEELDFVKKKFPKAKIEGNPKVSGNDQKAWYEVHIHPASGDREEESPEMIAIQKEKRRLEHELARLKKSKSPRNAKKSIKP